MPRNPLFTPSVSPTRTTKPTKAVNQTGTKVRLTHNTFDNSYFNFKTQRYAQYEPFWWKRCTPGDNEPLSVSHNVRSLPFASPILSPMTLCKDYFQVPNFAIQPKTWDYIFKDPTQGDDVPRDAHNVFPYFTTNNSGLFGSLASFLRLFSNDGLSDVNDAQSFLFALLSCELFFSSGSLLYNMGFKLNPVISDSDLDISGYSFDQYFDYIINHIGDFAVSFSFDDPDSADGSRVVYYSNDRTFFPEDGEPVVYIDIYTLLDLLRSNVAGVNSFQVLQFVGIDTVNPVFNFLPVADISSDSYFNGLNTINMDNIVAYQLVCAQYYVNPRVDFLYNAQLYRDNWLNLLRSYVDNLTIDYFDYNGIPVLYDYFSLHYFSRFADQVINDLSNIGNFLRYREMYRIFLYLFGYQQTLKFGNYFTDSRTQPLGYGQEGSDSVTVIDDAVSVTDMSQKLVLERFRGAVAHLDNSFEDYLNTMFHEVLPPDFHFPKFIAHSEFVIAGDEVSNTTSDNQGMQVTNLKSGNDTSEFNIAISVPSILIGISYIQIPRVYSQIKERDYMHVDRYDDFQPMLQYFGDQEIFNREKSDKLSNPADAYGFTSRYGEYKQRVSQVSGGFLCTSLRSWIMVDDSLFSPESPDLLLSTTQSPVAIRELPSDFARFLKAHVGFSLATDFHFIMQFNNKNVDNRPMEINPLPLYPNSTL